MLATREHLSTPLTVPRGYSLFIERVNLRQNCLMLCYRKAWSPLYSSENFFSNTHVSTRIQWATPEIPLAPLYLLYGKRRNALLTIGARFSNCCKFCNNLTIRNSRIAGISLEMCFASSVTYCVINDQKTSFNSKVYKLLRSNYCVKSHLSFD